MPVTEMLVKGKYFVAGVNLYYVKEVKANQGLLEIENCYTEETEWIKANKARELAREVINLKCEIMPVS